MPLDYAREYLLPTGIAQRDSFVKQIDLKTKPIGSLGDLERLAIRLCVLQNTARPAVLNPQVIVFAGDHGIAHERVSAFPPEVTFQMVYNFLQGGAAISTLCKEFNIGLTVVDAGVNHDFEDHPLLIRCKAGYGTKSFLNGPGMSVQQLESAFSSGRAIAQKILDSGTNVIGFGEMGIANTSSASLISHLLTCIPLKALVGSGTGLDTAGVTHKKHVLTEALNSFKPQDHNKLPHFTQLREDYLIQLFAKFAGFEMVMMASAMLETAKHSCVILVDGFISTAAYLMAYALNPSVRQFATFSHMSNEAGHKAVLEDIGEKSLLQMELRLGEGSGAALAIPLLRAACSICMMASFEGSGVSVML